MPHLACCVPGPRAHAGVGPPHRAGARQSACRALAATFPCHFPSSGVTFRHRSAALLGTLWCPPQSIWGARRLRPGGSPWRPGTRPLVALWEQASPVTPLLPAPLESASPGVGSPRLLVQQLGAVQAPSAHVWPPLPVLVPEGSAPRVSSSHRTAVFTDGARVSWRVKTPGAFPPSFPLVALSELHGHIVFPSLRNSLPSPFWKFESNLVT